MEIFLKYGRGQKRLTIPDRAQVSVLSPATAPTIEDLEEAVAKALDSPLKSPRLEEMAPPHSVAIAVSDESRPTPLKVLLPLLLKRLFGAFPRLRPEDVIVLVGAGLHPPLTDAQLTRLIPASVAAGCKVVCHDARRSAMTDYGRTRRNTPVRVNALFAGADLKIVIGNIDPHQFVGFTGGAKGAIIGCGAAETIEANHSLMFHDGAFVGNIEGNPVRQDIDEAGRMIGLSFVVNVVMDAHNRVVRLLAGDPEAVYREGSKTSAAIYGVEIGERFDIAVASCGGHPKDICLYQAQKGLAHAAQAVKPGGKILLLAACPEGVGDETYFQYVRQFPTPQAALEDFRRLGFRMGAHKAYLFGRTLIAYDVAVASEMDPATLAQCHLKACEPQRTLNDWIAGMENPRVAVIPNANTTYFFPGLAPGERRMQ